MGILRTPLARTSVMLELLRVELGVGGVAGTADDGGDDGDEAELALVHGRSSLDHWGSL